MTSKRSFGAALAGCAAGAGLALLAGSRTWQTTSRPRPAPLPPTTVAHAGNALVPWLLAVSLVALAGAGALAATRGGARRAVGGMVTLAGAGVAAAGARGLAYTLGWPLLALAGGVAIGACGALAIWRGGAWPAMGARYERPAGDSARARPATQAAMWDDLDRGVDPTRDGPARD